MKIPQFELERYFAEHEFTAPYLLCCSDCESFSLQEILGMEPGAADAFQELWLGYTESLGHPILRKQISSLYEVTHADQLLVYSGAEEAIFAFMNVMLEKGDHVVVHYPAYQSLFEIARAIGCDLTLWQGVDEQNWKLDMEYLKNSLRPDTKAVIINCPHNPTGFLMEKADFGELISLSQRHGFILFSDEVYRFLEYDEKDRLPALCDVDERGVSLGVMSKSFGLAGLRIGWAATRNRELFDKLAAYKDYTTICNSAPSEFLATVALKHKGRLVERNLGIIHKNLKILEQFFSKHGDIFRWAPPKAGPIAFPALANGQQIVSFCRDLVKNSGVLLVPGTIYGDFRKNFRIGFGRENLSECIEKLDDYLKSVQ